MKEVVRLWRLSISLCIGRVTSLLNPQLPSRTLDVLSFATNRRINNNRINLKASHPTTGVPPPPSLLTRRFEILELTIVLHVTLAVSILIDNADSSAAVTARDAWRLGWWANSAGHGSSVAPYRNFL